MSNRWSKLGLIFCPAGEAPWMQTHAAVPFAEKLSDDIIRIYFTTRDKNNRSHVAFVDISILDPLTILNISQEPVLTPGLLGEFDDSGAMGCWLTTRNNFSYLYYQGWNLGITVPFRNSIGLAVRDGNSNFHRYSPGPILDRTMFEPHFTATPCVIFDDNKWKMWYLSCTEWIITDKSPTHKYHIKYAESTDGIHWQRDGLIAIDYANSHEYAISRPSVVHDADRWRMWYSYRGQSYRIGYAESSNGIQWERLDHKMEFDVSRTGWDSEMIEYPYVFDHSDHRYMLYNGNGYGKTGFGLAVLEK